MKKTLFAICLILGTATLAYALPWVILDDYKNKSVIMPNAELSVADLKVTDDIVVTDDLTIGGDATITTSFVTSGAGEFKFTPGAVTAVGNSSATAALIASRIVHVSGADGAVGVRLPVGLTGSVYWITNVTAANLILYPDTGGSINGGGADAPVTVAAGERVIIFKAAALTWFGGVLVNF
jgi:hypothetical protein